MFLHTAYFFILYCLGRLGQDLLLSRWEDTTGVQACDGLLPLMVVFLLVLLQLQKHCGLRPVNEMHLWDLVALCSLMMASRAQLWRCFDEERADALLRVCKQTGSVQMTRYVCTRLRNVNLLGATWNAVLQEWHVWGAIVALDSNMVRFYRFACSSCTGKPSLVWF